MLPGPTLLALRHLLLYERSAMPVTRYRDKVLSAARSLLPAMRTLGIFLQHGRRPRSSASLGLPYFTQSRLLT